MSDPRAEDDGAARWLREADEELRAAAVTAEHPEIPDRVAGFHAHLAAEKALKSLLVHRGIEVPRIHDLIGLHRLLPDADQRQFAARNLEVLNPWTIEGRYPADLPDTDANEIGEVLAAARHVIEVAHDPPRASP